MRGLPLALLSVFVPFAAPPLAAQEPAAAPTDGQPAAAADRAATGPFRRDMVRELAWRNIGPANPMGRVTDIEVPTAAPSTWYVGTAGGGVWKTTNAGTTWTNVFDRVGNVSIGDVATAPSDPEVVWVGTGEENARNSVQWGDGVYRSTDGGATWQRKGLVETFQIGHIEIHPTDPDTVYVAALGRLWGPNDERGVYRSRDGGETWQQVLFVDAGTGCVDVRLDPNDPRTVYACMFERRRNEFDDNDPQVRFGAAAGLFRSDDGGDTWTELTTGLPTCQWGRSGIDLWAEDPSTLFLIVETERSGWAMGDRKDRLEGDPIPPQEQRRRGQGGGGGRRQARGTAVMGIGTEGDDGGDTAPGAVLRDVTDDGAAKAAGLEPGDRITQIDDEAVKTYEDLLGIIEDSRGGQVIQITYVRGDAESTVELTFGTRQRGGGVFPNGIYGGRLNGQQADVQDFQGPLGFETGGVFRSDDRGETWKRVNSLTERPFYYSVIRVDPQDAQHLFCVGTTLWGSSDGGAHFAGINRDIHVDFHALWVDPRNGNHLLAGCDGGVNESFDRGATWQVHRGFSAAQYYDVCADNSVPYNVMGGLQDNGTWVGPSRTRYREGITLADWRTVYGGDGFGAVTDPVEPWILYCTSQNGALGMVDLRARSQVRIQREPPEGGRAGFNWDSPFALSPHNRLILWSAGQYAYRSDRYAHLDNRNNDAGQGPIAPRRGGGPAGQRGAQRGGFGGGFGGGRGGFGGGGLRAELISPKLGRTEAGTATALAESPLVRELLYVGTDDGALWRHEDGAWHRLDDKLPALPGPRYVSDIVPSHHDADTVYVTLDGHRSDDFRTYAFVSADRGETWRSLTLDLPLFEPCYAIAEDPRNADLLFLGTEYGCHVSLDGGDRWFRFGSELPTVAVRDLFVHDRDSDLIAGTHGRGVWIADIAPLRELTAEVADAPAHLFAPEAAILWRMTSRGYSGNRYYAAPNPAYGADVYVYLQADTETPPVVTIHAVTGEELARLEGGKHRGVQRLHWDARTGDGLAEPGTYGCKLHFGEHTAARTLTLLPDPATTDVAAPLGNPTTPAPYFVPAAAGDQR